jgi:hypothetical protein
MPYTNVDIFLEKGVKSFSRKVWEPLNFMLAQQSTIKDFLKSYFPIQEFLQHLRDFGCFGMH